MTTIINQEVLTRQLQRVLKQYEHEGKHKSQTHHDPDLTGLLFSLENVIIESVLVHTRGNLQHAGRILGMNRGTIRKRWRLSRNYT